MSKLSMLVYSALNARKVECLYCQAPITRGSLCDACDKWMSDLQDRHPWEQQWEQLTTQERQALSEAWQKSRSNAR